MDVRVGSFSDPDGLDGLAHFLGECYHNTTDLLHSLMLMNQATSASDRFDWVGTSWFDVKFQFFPLFLQYVICMEWMAGVCSLNWALFNGIRMHYYFIVEFEASAKLLYSISVV